MSLFSIGLSGLSAAQTALQTTGSNISNVYTPGYNRQLTLLGESSTGANGVQVNDVQRQFNQYIASQLNQATGSTSALQAYSTQVSQIDNLLADREAGLAPLMQSFFSSLEDLAGAPSDPAARQGVIGTADTLTAQFRAFDSYLDDMQSGINGQIRDEVTQINNVAEQMAKLNKEISLAKAKTGEAPNSLLNQRDQIVAELSERLGVNLSVQDGGTYNLTIGNGQPLVAGTRSYPLEAIKSAADPSRTVVAYHDAGGSTVELSESTFERGTLGGLMAFRRETLDKTQNQVGQMALALAEGFNAQHRLGQDLNGQQGMDFFSIDSPTVFSNEKNVGNAQMAAKFSDFSQVTTSDYEIRYDGSSYSVTDLATNKEVPESEVELAISDGAGTLSFHGVELSITAGAEKGDRFVIQPTRNLAGSLQNQIRDTAEIAAGKIPVNTLAMPHEKVKFEGIYESAAKILPLNEIEAESRLFRVDDQKQPISFFISNSSYGDYEAAVFYADDPDKDVLSGGDYKLLDADGNEFNDPLDIPANGSGLNPGDKLTLVDKEGNKVISFVVEELPQGEAWGVAFGKGSTGTGDNRNALALQNLQNIDLVDSKASLNEAYASLVSDVGNRTNVVKVNLSAQEGLKEQLFAVQQSESGVNLDEEAANLIRYQQFYQANAKVIQTGSTILDSILNLR